MQVSYSAEWFEALISSLEHCKSHVGVKLNWRSPDASSPMKTMELPSGPITRARAKRFQEVVASYIARVWMEGMAEHQVTSPSSAICNVVHVDLARTNSKEFMIP
ncbi:hypothetical protein GOBAR_AA36394 [Gossypium barbadense]|uniref:Uncharacterized protein n=1 Tax=Gossypium barbadense TaxID=3634 RepID=A0A2P5VZQ1_GOSBA|nr:hypothetical protein GOBAR_AA36394 [Gossypium barbadense]